MELRFSFLMCLIIFLQIALGGDAEAWAKKKVSIFGLVLEVPADWDVSVKEDDTKTGEPGRIVIDSEESTFGRPTIMIKIGRAVNYVIPHGAYPSKSISGLDIYVFRMPSSIGKRGLIVNYYLARKNVLISADLEANKESLVNEIMKTLREEGN